MDEKPTTKTTIEMPTPLLKRAKIQAIKEGSDLRTLVIEGLEMRLRASKGGEK